MPKFDVGVSALTYESAAGRKVAVLTEAVAVAVGVCVEVAVAAGVCVGVSVGPGVDVSVAVGVSEGVTVCEGVAEAVGVSVIVGV